MFSGSLRLCFCLFYLHLFLSFLSLNVTPTAANGIRFKSYEKNGTDLDEDTISDISFDAIAIAVAIFSGLIGCWYCCKHSKENPYTYMMSILRALNLSMPREMNTLSVSRVPHEADKRELKNPFIDQNAKTEETDLEGEIKPLLSTNKTTSYSSFSK